MRDPLHKSSDTKHLKNRSIWTGAHLSFWHIISQEHTT